MWQRQASINQEEDGSQARFRRRGDIWMGSWETLAGEQAELRGIITSLAHWERATKHAYL